MGRIMKPLETMFPNDNATIAWLKQQKKGTQNAYKFYWLWFTEFTGMNGTQILANRKQDKEHKWEKKLMKFWQWCLKHTCEIHEKPLSENGAKSACGVVRGFFAFHYEGLKVRRADSEKIKNAKRKMQDFKLSVENIRRMSVQANLRDRYVLMVGKSLGFRASDFINLKVGDFVCLDLEQPAPISMGQIDTTKEGVPAFPFLDSDAIPIVKAYLEGMGTQDPNAKMLNIKQNELTAILKRLAQKANINLGNKNLRFHCCRKFLCDKLSAVMSESKWKQIVGKKIDEKAYVSESELKQAYAVAMKKTTINEPANTVFDKQKITELKQAIIRLQQDVSAYKTTNEVLANKIAKIETILKTLPLGRIKDRLLHQTIHQ